MSQNYSCDFCGKNISSPVCEYCLTKQLAIWLNQAGINPKYVSRIVGSIYRKLPLNIQEETLCIICGNHFISACTSCYFDKIRNVLYYYLPEDTVKRVMIILEDV